MTWNVLKGRKTEIKPNQTNFLFAFGHFLQPPALIGAQER